MRTAGQEAGVPGLGELLDGFTNMLPNAANDPVGK